MTLVIINATDADNDAVRNITDWRLNGTSIAVVNLPFETNLSSVTAGAVRDYSTFENNGTLGDGITSAAPQWNSSGKVGGAYTFNGTTNITLGDVDFAGNFTVEAWINTAVKGNFETLVSKRGATHNIHFRINNTGIIDCLIFDGVLFPEIAGPDDLANGQWHHVACVRDTAADALLLYVNGTLVNSTTDTTTGSIANDNSLTIGGRNDNINNKWNGSLDEVRIYTRALSSDQIYRSFIDGNNSRHLSGLVRNETAVGDSWSVAVTPNDNQPNTDGATVLSNNVTILADELNQTEAALLKLDAPDPLNLSATTLLNYSITFNLTNGSASNVTINETYPDNVSFVSANPAPDAGNSSWNAGNLTAPFVYNISVQVNVSPYFANGTLLNNTVNVTYNNGSGDFTFQNVTAQTTLINEQQCPLTIAASTTLTQNISCPATAINILADNVVLDCAGFTVIWNTAGAGSRQGVRAANLSNVTVQNCILIDTNASGADGIGIYLDGTNDSTVTNVSIQGNGTGTNAGVLIERGNRNRVDTSTVRLAATGSLNDGIRLFDNSNDNTIDNNQVTVTAAFFDNGIEIEDGSSGNTITRNTVTVTGGDAERAVRINNAAASNLVAHNALSLSGTTNTFGILLNNGAPNNTLWNNTLNVAGTTGFGISVQDGSNGTAIQDSSVDITIASGFAVRVTSSVNVSLANMTLQSRFGWIDAAAAAPVNLTNVSFQTGNGSIRIGNATIPANITRNSLNISLNNSFLNSTNLSFLNTSAQITLENIVQTDPRPVVDFEDDGTFANCDPPTCVEVSYNGSTYVFNVSHFTSFAVQENLTFVINLSAEKADSPDPVPRGGTLSYTITLNNTGNATAQNVTVVEIYPPNVSFVSGEPTPSGNDTFSVGNISPGGSFVVNITVTVGSTVVNGTVLNNTVNVTFANSSGENSSFLDSELTTVLGAPVLVSIKSDTPDPVVRGATLNYSILINNTGDDTAFNVSLTENYPAGVSFVTAQPTPAGNNTFTIGTLAPNESFVVNATVTVGTTLTNGTVLNNSVNASWRNSSGQQGGVSDSELTTVLGIASINVTKTDSPDPVNNGSTLAYSITVTNTGDEVAYNITVIEGYDVNITFNGSSPAPSSGNNTFTLGNLTPGASTTLNITVNVSSAMTSGVLNNTVNVTFTNLTGENTTVSAFQGTAVTTPFVPPPAPVGGGGGGGGSNFLRPAQIGEPATPQPSPLSFPATLPAQTRPVPEPRPAPAPEPTVQQPAPAPEQAPEPQELPQKHTFTLSPKTKDIAIKSIALLLIAVLLTVLIPLFLAHLPKKPRSRPRAPEPPVRDHQKTAKTIRKMDADLKRIEKMLREFDQIRKR
ncbi:DUF11 domain-containing protein [Candidatus Woesearchaeota archaeon]|nr:MAG: DUF11 domain-containing protein [Candidatus Woesearchaeota archaeon]